MAATAERAARLRSVTVMPGRRRRRRGPVVGVGVRWCRGNLRQAGGKGCLRKGWVDRVTPGPPAPQVGWAVPNSGGAGSLILGFSGTGGAAAPAVTVATVVLASTVRMQARAR